MKSTIAGYVGIGAFLIGWCGALGATAARAAGDSDTLEEVVVTAERHEESLQKTPMNVTVISGDTIQQQGLTDMQEILQNVPGVTVQGQVRGFNITVRGLGTDLPPGSAQGTVAVEADGVYDIRAESGTVGYYDLQRVEVLAGPQGTLYGVNSDGGVANIITNNPLLGKYDANGSLTFGSDHLAQGQAALNLPVGGSAALRIAVSSTSRDGFLDTGASDNVSQGARAKFLWQPSDQFSLLVGYEMAKIGGKGSGDVAAYAGSDCHHVYNPYTGTTTYLKDCWTDLTSPVYGIATGGTNAADTVESDTNQWVNYHSDKYWADVKWDLGFGKLSFTPAYKLDRATDNACGMGLCTYGGDPGKLSQSSEELKLTQADGSRLQWALGLYHWGYSQYTFGAGPSGSVWQSSDAAFGELTYPVGDALRLKAGVRESRDWKNQSGAATTLTFHHFDYRVGAEFDVAPESMLYATVATGYRPGGYNTSAPVVTTYQSEQVTDYEVGLKNRFLDDRLQLNVDAFYYDYKNYQLNDFYQGASLYCNNALNVASGPPISDYENFQARNLGADLSAAWVATQHDTINASVTYLDNKFTSAGTVYYNPVTNCQAYLQGLDATETNTVLAQEISDAVQPHSPTLAGSLSLEHRFTFSDGGNLALRPAVRITSGYYVNPLESVYSYQPAFQKYDLSSTYSAADGKWSLALWGRNLANYAEKTNFVAGTGGIGEPRTYGITVSGHL
ncbi:MAG TPA: TonB-dependent receptor [Steroidobacteraceae bacterium]|nr:TonB-dependent receptor [Steroidobacteraceae bacterium]